MAKKQTAGRDHLGKLAPKFAELNDDVLFGEVWSREKELSPRDRSMVTIAALFSAGLYPQLKAHLAIGKDHASPYVGYQNCKHRRSIQLKKVAALKIHAVPYWPFAMF